MTFRVRPGLLIFTLMVPLRGAVRKATAVLFADPILWQMHIRCFLSLNKWIRPVSTSITYVSIHVVQAGILSLRFLSQLQWLMEATPSISWPSTDQVQALPPTSD